MTTRSGLSAYDLLRIAREQVSARHDSVADDIATWIEDTIHADEERIDAERAAPLATPVGTIEVGKTYNVTMTGLGYDRDKVRTFRGVTLRRGGYAPKLVYPSRAAAANLFTDDLKRITKIEEVSG